VSSPRCLVIAGPNGAGKTTFAREFLPREAAVIHFVNVDLIARGPCEPLLYYFRAWEGDWWRRQWIGDRNRQQLNLPASSSIDKTGREHPVRQAAPT
jgi:predicted ATPase